MLQSHSVDPWQQQQHLINPFPQVMSSSHESAKKILLSSQTTSLPAAASITWALCHVNTLLAYLCRCLHCCPLLVCSSITWAFGHVNTLLAYLCRCLHCCPLLVCSSITWAFCDVNTLLAYLCRCLHCVPC